MQHRHGDALAHAHQHQVQGGTPVIDIGDDIGALVVFMDDAEKGTELFLRPEGEPASTLHTGVWTRQHRGGHVTAAVFGELVEGSYWVLDAVGSDRFSVQIRGGELTQVDVRTGGRTPA
jgi:hypothetical protein